MGPKIISGVERRRWSTADELRIVAEADEPGAKIAGWLEYYFCFIECSIKAAPALRDYRGSRHLNILLCAFQYMGNPGLQRNRLFCHEIMLLVYSRH